MFSIGQFTIPFEKFGIMCGPAIGVSYSVVNNRSNQTGTNANNSIYSSSSNGNYPQYYATRTESVTFQPYLGVVLGVVYKINTNFFVYAEVVPNVYYARTNSTSNTTNINNNSVNTNYSANSSTFNNTFGLASLSNSGAAITLVYRIYQ